MSITRKKILISGGTGFLGKNLLKRLGNKYDIVVLTRNITNLGNDSKAHFELRDSNDFLLKNVDESFDLFIHASSDTRKNGVLLDSVESNIVWPLKVINKIQSSKLKIINIDTTYYESEKNNYSLTKKHFSEALALLDFPIINFKIDNIYGEFDNSSRFIPKILNDLFSNVPVIDLTEGTQKRDFVHVKDVVDLLALAIEKILTDFQGYQSFDIGCGNPISVRDAVTILKEASGNTQSKLNFGAIKYKVVNPLDLNSQVDISKTKEFFNWSPNVVVKDGFQQLANLKRK